MITSLRWRLYKALCWVAWQVCPSKQARELNSIWVAGIEQWKRDLAIELLLNEHDH